MSDLDYSCVIVRNFKGNPTTIKIPLSRVERLSTTLRLNLTQRDLQNFRRNPQESQLSDENKIFLISDYFPRE